MKIRTLKSWFNRYANIPVLVILSLVIVFQILYIIEMRHLQVKKRGEEIERLIAIANLGILNNDRPIIETTLDVITHDMNAKMIFFCEKDELITSYPTLAKFDCNKPQRTGFNEDLVVISPKGTPQFVFYFYFPVLQGLRSMLFMLSMFVAFSLFMLVFLQFIRKRIRDDLITPIEALVVEGSTLEHSKIQELDEIADKNRQINQLKEAEILAKQAQFMAHDIRRPFSQIKLLLSTLNTFSSDPAKIDRAKQEIETSIKDVESMLSDLIEANKNESLNIKPCVLMDLVDKSIKQVSVDINNIKIYRELDDNVVLLCDEQKIGRCLTNIIENAVEAINSAGNNVEGKISISANDNIINGKRFVGINIFNNGPSIDKEDIPRIFDRFFTRAKKKGVGLGLAFVYRTVSIHNGIVEVRNMENGSEGVEFSIYLPKIDSVKLLLLEDDELYRTMMRKLIEDANGPVRISVLDTAYVEEAVELTRKENITHSLVDIDLGNGSTGFDYIDAITKIDRKILVGVHTNRLLDKDLGALINKNKVEYIPKPLDLNKFYSFIYKYGGTNV